MSECPYLKFSESKSCVNCTGYRCVAYGREKKLSDTTQCKSNYMECLRYIDIMGVKEKPMNIPTISPETAKELLENSEAGDISITPLQFTKPVFIRNPCGCGEDVRLSLCPYQSTTLPEGKSSCTGVWCYANNKSIRVPKNCWNYSICTVYLMSKFKGVPYP